MCCPNCEGDGRVRVKETGRVMVCGCGEEKINEPEKLFKRKRKLKAVR